MRGHVWRPLFVVIGLIALILLFRVLVVPDDFGAHERGYMYGWHRQGNESEWRAQPVKFRTADYCADCHDDKTAALSTSPHHAIQCENCHGPAESHPEEPARLAIDRSRDLCLRCHSRLPYPTSGRSAIPGIDPQGHNPGLECADCHDPHHPDLEAM